MKFVKVSYNMANSKKVDGVLFPETHNANEPQVNEKSDQTLYRGKRLHPYPKSTQQYKVHYNRVSKVKIKSTLGRDRQHWIQCCLFP